MNSYYTGNGIGFRHLGEDAPLAPVPAPVTDPAGGTSVLTKLAAIGGTLSMPALAYHGYKRNDSVGWALVWGFFGSWVWPITVPIALAQGFAKRRVAPNRRRRSSRRRRTSRQR